MVKGLLIGVTAAVLLISGSAFSFMLHKSKIFDKITAIFNQENVITGEPGLEAAGNVSQPLALNESRINSIPLDQRNQQDNNLLKIDNSVAPSQDAFNENTSPRQSSGTKNTVSVPGPETFGEYERYKPGERALYADIVIGNGSEAIAGSVAAVAYSGWLTDGTLFDKSNPGDPFIFKLAERKVIIGWEEGIAGMKVGGKRRLVVPPAAGYGAEAKPKIPANSVLVFDVELVAIQ